MVSVSVENLIKHYRKTKAVDGISFSVEKGEIFGLLGPNGAGKTTTIECLEGLRSYDAGNVFVLGLDPNRDGKSLRKRIGMQLQEAALPNDIKVWEAMDLYASFYESSVDWKPLLEQVGLSEKYGSVFSKLSGGQKQRLYIALALLNDPEIVFFDEITTGLDPQARRTMWDLVRNIKENGKTVFLTIHYMDEAETLCDRVTIIDNGKIINSGTTDELVANSELDNRVVFKCTRVLPEDYFKAVPHVTGVTRKDEQYAVTGKGDLLIKEIIDKLVEDAIPFRNIRMDHADLEDVFLALTGKRIRQ